MEGPGDILDLIHSIDDIDEHAMNSPDNFLRFFRNVNR